MFYEAELRFLRETFRKCHIPTGIVDLSAPIGERQDLPLYIPHTHLDKKTPVDQLLPPVKECVIYRLTTALFQKYLYFLLPELPSRGILLIGPFLEAYPSSAQIMEWAEQNGIPPAQVPQLEQYCWGLPIFPQNSQLHVMLDTLGERLWGVNGYRVEEIGQSHTPVTQILPSSLLAPEGSDTLWNMKNMERRYAFENEMLEAVSKGHAHKADTFFFHLPTPVFEQRLPDPIRNGKNYCIIMNTLLRKAAEKGGVHPLYLDSISSNFANRIEQTNSLDTMQHLTQEMFQSYCLLVKEHATKNYSQPVQQALTYIDSYISGDLSLQTISGLLNVSSSYFSTLFKKETGVTLTEYINDRRIKHAMYLLQSTRLQIQTIAQHCGIVDVHYFSKVFKKALGMTPKEYRNSFKS